MATVDPLTKQVIQQLTTAVDPSTKILAELHHKLEKRAHSAGLVDVAYTTIDSPVGQLLLATTPHGLVRVAYECEDFTAVLNHLADQLSPRILSAPRQLDNAKREFDEYFQRKRTTFDIPLDFTLSKGFRNTVQRHLIKITYGHTKSYKDVAQVVGNPKAVRAVGSACRTNPLPVIVPCHRVLRTDGALGGYIGGLDAKTTLLNLEKTT